MYRYACSFYPAYLGEDETTLQLFGYSTSGFMQAFLQPLTIGCKVATHAFNESGKNNFNPIDYYPNKFKDFPKLEYSFGIVLDVLIHPVSEYETGNYSKVLIALVTADERLIAIPNTQLIEHPNPSTQNLSW